MAVGRRSPEQRSGWICLSSLSGAAGGEQSEAARALNTAEDVDVRMGFKAEQGNISAVFPVPP